MVIPYPGTNIADYNSWEMAPYPAVGGDEMDLELNSQLQSEPIFIRDKKEMAQGELWLSKVDWG